MAADEKAQLVRWITAELPRGYRIDWAALDRRSLREVQRLVLDLAYQRPAANSAAHHACAYLNEDKALHGHVKWRLDAGKLQAALEFGARRAVADKET